MANGGVWSVKWGGGRTGVVREEGETTHKK